MRRALVHHPPLLMMVVDGMLVRGRWHCDYYDYYYHVMDPDGPCYATLESRGIHPTSTNQGEEKR